MGTSTSPFEWESHRVRISAANPVHARVVIPGSKSLTNRLLLLSALAPGESRLGVPLDAQDTRLMADALEQMGVSVDRASQAWSIHPKGTLQVPQEGVYVGNAGTVMRFLTPLLATLPGASILNCSANAPAL